jgi:hypothetical protein
MNRSPSEWPARASVQADLSNDSANSWPYSPKIFNFADELAICINDRLGSSDRVGRRHHMAYVPPIGREEIRSWCVVGYVGPFRIFDSIWILTKQMLLIWKKFFTKIFRISSSFIVIFLIF